MRSTKKKKAPSTAIINNLSRLEDKALQQGIQVHYDLLEAAGLKLKGGLCKIKGELHLFIDRRKSAIDRIEILQDYVDNPIPEDIPENFVENATEDNTAE